jgi:hypothetical protein
MISEKTKKQLTTVIFYMRVIDIVFELVTEKHPEVILKAIKKALDELE